MALLDVIHEIKLDHDNVRDLFERFQAAVDTAEKATLANTLVREMAIHGDAEEASIYKDYSVLGLGNSAEHNKEEHAEIKELIFITHAKEEEDEQHPIIREKLSPEDSDKLARTFLKARTAVPTRPHPDADGVAEKAAGLQEGLVDEVVEAVQGRDFAPLKYTHPEI